MLKRIITALAIIAVVIPPLMFGGILNYLLVALIVLVGGMELSSILPGYHKVNKMLYIVPLIFAYALYFVDVEVAVALLTLIVLSLLSIPVFVEKYNSEDALMSAAIVILFYVIGKAYLAIYDLGLMYLIFILIATFATDTGAYFTGYFFGKRKLCERISPKKTIEGSIGGVAFSWVLATLFIVFVFKEANFLLVLLTGLVMPFTSQIGDLAFSALKRLYNIKDFSNILPGHGGFMDRLDSLVFNLAVFYAFMVVIL